MDWLKNPNVETAMAMAMNFAPFWPSARPHHLRRRNGCSRQSIRAQHAHAHHIHQHIKKDDSGDPDQQRSREILARVLDLSGDEVCCLPSAKSEQHRYHRGAECCQQSRRRWAVEYRTCNGIRRVHQKQACGDEPGDCSNLQHHQRTLHAGSQLHAHAIHHRENCDRDDGDHAIGNSPSREIEQVARESDRHCRHAACLDNKQQNPSVEKSERRMVGIAQIRVLASDVRSAGPPIPRRRKPPAARRRRRPPTRR